MRKIILISVLLSACATTSENMEPVENKATLIAKNDAWGKSLVPLQVQANTRFESLDGNKISNFWSSTEELAIEPGEHTVVVSCYLRRGGLHQRGEHVFTQLFEKEKVYLFSGKLGGGSQCEVSVEVI